MLDETNLLDDEELDIMVLSARAIEAYMILYNDAQRDKMMPHLRGLLAYEASRPAVARRSNVLDFQTALIKSRLEKSVRSQRQSALVEGQNILQHGVNAFGDCIWPDID